MIKRRLSVYFTIALGLLFFSSPILAQNYMVSSKNGVIDWTNGIIEAVGIGVPPRNPTNVAQARAAAKTAAITAARHNLTEILMEVRIDSKTLIKDFASQSEQIRTEFQRFLHNSEIAKISYTVDDSVEATMEMKLTGSFADMVLPKSIRAIHPIQQPVPPSQEKGEAYTGLLLDCRGFKLMPALALRILDEDGNEVYGTSYVSREYAVQHGMAGYAKGLKAANVNQRVANNPLTVKGLRTAESALSDVVISNADAERIRRAASNLSFLQKCRVMIVVE